MPVGTWSMVHILRLCRRKTALFLGLSYIRIVQKTLPFGGFLPLLHRIAFNHLIGAVIKAGDNRFPHRVALIIKFRGAGQALVLGGLQRLDDFVRIGGAGYQRATR